VLCLPIAIDSSREAFRDHRTRAAFPAEDFLTFRPQLDRQGSLGTTGELSDSDFNAQVLRVIGELSRRLENEPGVALTFGSALPGASHPLRPVEAQRDGEPPFVVKANTEGLVRTAAVDIRFFDTFRVPLKAGRGFEHGDVGAAHRVVIINESLARNLGGNPLGMRVREAARGEDDDTGPWHEVIGVVRNLDTEPTNRGEADFMYAPASTVDAYPPAVVLRVLGDPNAFVPRLREIAAQVDPGLRLYDLLPLGEVIRRRDAPMVQAHHGVIGVVLLAIALSAASLYALMSVAVARRTREIAIRIAVGASRTAVLLAVFRKAGLQVGAGLLVGNLLIGALAFAGYSSPMHVVLGISGAVGLVGLLACWVPARHALRIEPTLALKQDR
jgi:hypothetical protein